MIRAAVRIGIDNPVLLNLAFLLVVVAGVAAYVRMPKEEFPPIDQDRILVGAVWPGSAPEEVEDQVLRPLEDALDEVEGISHVYADASDGRAILTLELTRGTEVDATRDEVRRAVDALRDLPDDLIGPDVTIARIRNQLLHVALLGDPRRVDVADQVSRELLAQPGVSEVLRHGAWERHVRVSLDPERSTARGVGPQAVVAALGAASVGAPAGSMEVLGQSVLVRTPQGVTSTDALASVPLAVGGGSMLTVGDVATIEEVWEAPEVTVRVNGQPAIDLVVMRMDDADALSVVPELEAWTRARAAELPPGLDLVAYDDSARFVRDRLNTLASNGVVGILLVALVLALFVGVRSSALVIWGMPVAYLGAVIALHMSGASINLISMFGLLLVTGIIVDDAIVIVENVQRHLELGKTRVQATLDGTTEVFGAVFAATLTTCLAFAPLLMLEGVVGQVMRIIPVVVILSLVASLLEAFLVLPGHLGHYAIEGTHGENALTRALKRLYEPVLTWSTAPHRRWTALGLLVFFVAGSTSLSLTMHRTLTTPGEPVFAFVDLDLPPSADADATRDVLRDLEGLIGAEAADLVHFMRSRVGEQGLPPALPKTGARYGQLVMGFHDTPEVLARVPAFLDRLDAYLTSRADVPHHVLTTLTGGPPVGAPVDVRVRGADGDAVLDAAERLAAWLADRPGLSNVRTDVSPGNEAFEVRVDPLRASQFGLSEEAVAMRVRAAIDGAVALELPVDERTTEVRVTRDALADPGQLADLPLMLPDGRTVRLRQVATVVRSRGVEQLSRVDGERSIRLTADLDTAITSVERIRGELDARFANLGETCQDCSLLYGGEAADIEESFRNLPIAALLALGLIYAVLAVQFRSYVQPLLILAAVPLGISGAIIGLFVLRMDLSLIAMIGAVGLIGIVVNDSLVLVDFINRLRHDGATARDAVIEASLVRLRPILITTITTVLGLLPLALGIAGDEPLLAPMAVTMSFGLIFATSLTLVAVPVLYLLLPDDLSPRHFTPPEG